MYLFKVARVMRSYQFKKDMSQADSWDKDFNAQNNMLDDVFLYKNNDVIFWAKAQTVANMPGARHTDTIIPGTFYIKWDVPRRSFKGHIHGIVGAYDQDGQRINEDSIETIIGKNGAPVDWTRWIAFHSTLKNDPAPMGEVTRYAWSAGCFIVTPERQESLWVLGQKEGFKTGDLIPCELYEV
jgi:hypothetical protein